MELGCFSVSLTVKSLEASCAFYAALGFTEFHGDKKQGWLMMKNGQTNIGLFEGMFDKNILTFNPGWDQDAKSLNDFMDIRKVQQELKENGVTCIAEADEHTSGPAHCIIEDPDGNQIMLDQHV